MGAVQRLLILGLKEHYLAIPGYDSGFVAEFNAQPFGCGLRASGSLETA